MNNFLKFLIILLVVVILVFIALRLTGWSPQFLHGAVSREQKEEIVDNNNQIIQLEDKNTSLIVKASPDDKIHFVFFESEKEKYVTDPSEGISYRKESTNKWFDFLWFEVEPSTFTIMLPEKYQGKIHLKTTNGQIDIKQIGAEEFHLHSTNGELDLQDLKVQTINAETTNGKIHVKNLSVSKDLQLSSTNGDIMIKDLSAQGDIRLHTTNSDITGNILSNMNDFSIESKTTNGDNNLPGNTKTGGRALQVETTNGDIQLDFMK